MSWFSTWLHNTLVPTIQKSAADPNVQSAFVTLIKGLVATVLANPGDTKAILQNAAANAEKLVGAAVAGTKAQGLVDADILPPSTPPAPATTVPSSPGAPPA